MEGDDGPTSALEVRVVRSLAGLPLEISFTPVISFALSSPYSYRTISRSLV